MYILQESNRPGFPVDDSALDTCHDPSNMTQPPPPEPKPNERCVDWPGDDDVIGDDDVRRSDAVNGKNGEQTKRASVPADWKSSFGFFGGRQDRKSKNKEEEEGILRRPKRFFSQQNLRAASRDESPVIENNPPRFFAPPKFIARLMSSHQRHRSSQDLPSVQEDFRSPPDDQGRPDVNTGPMTSLLGSVSSVSSSASSSCSAAGKRSTIVGKSPQSDVRVGPEGMEGECTFETEASSHQTGCVYSNAAAVTRLDGDSSAPGKCPSWSDWQEAEEYEEEKRPIPEPGHVDRLRQYAVTGHDLSACGRFIGEYRPRLNTHPEEPTGAVPLGDSRPRTSEVCSAKSWSVEAFQDQTSFSGTPLGLRDPFDGSVQDQVSLKPVDTNGTLFSLSPLVIGSVMSSSREPTVNRQRLDPGMDPSRICPVLRNCHRTDGEDLGSTELRQVFSPNSAFPSQHSKSASYDNGVGEHQGNSDLRRRLHVGNTLPSRFSPNQVQTLRQRSQEFYGGNHPLGQHMAVSSSEDIVGRSVWDQRRERLVADHSRRRLDVDGCTWTPDVNNCSPVSISEAFRDGPGWSERRNFVGSSQLDPGHFRSLSMSQLQTGTSSDDLPQWTESSQRDGYRQTPPSAAQQRALPPNTTWFPGSGRDSRYLQQVGTHHERGAGSLDSSDRGRSSLDTTMVDDLASSDPEVIGNFKRRSCDQSERPLRYRFSGCHGSGRHGSGRHGNVCDDATAARGVQQQQQAVLSLFQRLTLARQQKMRDATDSSMGCREPLLASHIQMPDERVETMGGLDSRGTATTGAHTSTLSTQGHARWNPAIRMSGCFPHDLDFHLPTEPELLSPCSPLRVGHQPRTVAHEKSSFHSYEGWRTDAAGSMDPLRIDESKFRLAGSKSPEISDNLTSNVEVRSRDPVATSQHGSSSGHVISQPTTHRPFVIQPSNQNAGQGSSKNPPPLPPKSFRLQQDIYANQLRHSARKLSLSSGSLRTWPSSIRDNMGEDEANSVFEDLGRCDADTFCSTHLLHQPQVIQAQQQEHRRMENGWNEEPVKGFCLTDDSSITRSEKPVLLYETDSPLSRDQLLTKLPSSFERRAKTDKYQMNNEYENYDLQDNFNGLLCEKMGFKGKSESRRAQDENGCVINENGRVHSEDGRARNKDGRVENQSGRGQNEHGRGQNDNEHAQRENGHAEIEDGGNENGHVQKKTGCVQSENGSGVSEAERSHWVNNCVENELLDACRHAISTSDVCSNHTGNPVQPIITYAGDVTCSDQFTSGSDALSVTALRTPDAPKGVPPRRNGSVLPHTGPSQYCFGEPVHSLKDFPDTDSFATSEDESFRGLASVVCRHLGSADEELCSVLRPPFVKASAEFVRQIFECRSALDLDLAGLLHQPCRTSRSSTEAPKDSKVPHSSLQTLKDELLSLVERKLQRQLDRKQLLSEREVELRLLERKLTGIIREKLSSRQFEKFLSYMEQLEKVIQLLLNLTVRLSSVQKALCHISEGSNETEEKLLSVKQCQIMERLKEAMELKLNIDERSQQMTACLSDCLTPEEFNEYREMIRSRCHVTLQAQAIADQSEVALMQKKVLLVRCQGPQRSTPHPEITQLQLNMTNVLPRMSQVQPEMTPVQS